MIYCIKMLVDSWDKTQAMDSTTAFDYGQFMIITTKKQNIWPLDIKLTHISYTVVFRN